MKTDRYFESRLLSRSKDLTVEEREALFNRVLVSVSGKPPLARPRLLRWRPALIGAIALSGVIVLALPLLLSRTEERSEFTPKGVAQSSPSLRLSCISHRGPAPCKQGDKLAFIVQPSPERPYLFAFSRRETDGMILWYFPEDENGQSLLATDTHETGALTQGIVIGPEHRPGRYTLYSAFTEKPLHRSQIRDLIDNGADRNGRLFLNTKQIFEVAP